MTFSHRGENVDKEAESKKRKLIQGIVISTAVMLFYLYFFLTGFFRTCTGVICLAAGSVIFIITAARVGKIPKGLARYLICFLLVLFVLFLVDLFQESCGG
jgi:hypothetical protein